MHDTCRHCVKLQRNKEMGCLFYIICNRSKVAKHVSKALTFVYAAKHYSLHDVVCLHSGCILGVRSQSREFIAML